MSFVLDASVTLTWYFPDEQTPKALEARGRLAVETGLVPPHWWYEVCHTILVAERRNRTSEQDASNALAWLARLPIQRVEGSNGLAIFALARRHRLTFYDAAYLELAVRENVGLATLDTALLKAAKSERVPLLIKAS